MLISGFEWTKETLTRNHYQGDHRYVCLGDGQYKDVDTNVTVSVVLDECVPTKTSCTTPQLDNTVTVDTECNGADCKTTVTCVQGMTVTLLPE